MTDSGGYQIAQGKAVCAEASLRWQEDNCDVGFNLDVPLTDRGHFDMCLRESVENFKVFEKKRKNYNMRLYNVLHGRSLPEIETWYGAVKDFNFDGWALGIKGTIYMQILAYLVLHENNALNLKDCFHLFGTSSVRSMLALAVLSKHFDTAITFDSSSYSRESKFRSWNFQGSIRHKAGFGRNAKRALKAIPCRCPVCSNATIEDLYKQTEPSVAHLLIAMHNLYQYIEINRNIGIMVDDDEVFRDYARSLGELELVQNVSEMLEEYESGGYQNVYEKFQGLINGTQKEKRYKASVDKEAYQEYEEELYRGGTYDPSEAKDA